MKYAEHHLHTDFSPLDGVSTAEDYMRRAKEIGIDHLTITDHKTLGGHHAFQEAGKKHGISVGLGLEGYFSTTDRFDRRSKKERDDGTQVYNHIGIIAKNENGLKNLNALNRIAWTEGFFSVPRLDMELLEEYHEDLIVLSGCMSGVVSRRLEAGDYEQAMEWAGKFKSLMGDDYYMEVMAHNPDELTKGHFAIADELGIKVITTSDCHHAAPTDLVLQEAMLILQTGPNPAKDISLSKAEKMDFLERFNYLYPERSMTFEKYELHLHTGLEHFNKLKELGYDRTDFIENTLEIAEKIGDYPTYKNLDLLPKPKVDDVDAYLRQRVMAGARKRGHFNDPVYMQRLEHELDIITKKNFSTYFLIKSDIDAWARKQGIRCGPGRGSSAGSLVCYDLYITNVDPIEYNLLFERFLDAERLDWPDIDSDYQDDRRHEVKAYMKKRFKNTGNIQTYTYLNGKNIFKDAARVLKIPLATATEISQKIDDWDDYLTNPKTKEFRQKYPSVERLGNLMRGRLRSVGMHAAGVVVSSEPLANYAAVETAEDKQDKAAGRQEVLAMNDSRAAELGLIKFDILGLTALTNIQTTLDMVKERHGIDIDLDNISLDDPAVYKSITKRSALGIFQVEGNAFTKILDEMPIEEFNDLVSSTALIRPGASDSSFGKRYLDARNGKDWKPYCEAMRPFTEETYGEILYQEQLMLTVTEVAGMTTGEANKIRKVIGKKRDVSELEEYREKFVLGASEKLGKRGAAKMWTDFEKSANYQFNKSHAVAYSMITYYTAWLKHYYPVEFMMSLLSKESDKVVRINYLNECKRMGIKIRVPHVEHSDIFMRIEGDSNSPALRMGLADCKYVGPAVADKIIKARPFGSYAKLIEVAETKYSGIGKRSIEYLDKIGACRFDDRPLRGDERDHYFDVLNIPAFDFSAIEEHTRSLFRPLEAYDKEGAFVLLALVQKVTRKNGWARADLFDETGTAGVFFDPELDIAQGRFYVFLIADGSIQKFFPAEDIQNQGALSKYLMTERLQPFDGHRIVSLKSRRTKAGKIMGTLVTTDADKRLEAFTVYESEFYKTHTLAEKGAPVQIEATEKEWNGKKSNVLRSIA